MVHCINPACDSAFCLLGDGSGEGMNIFKNTGIECFAVQHESLNRIRELGKPKMKQAALKLYLFLCNRTSRDTVEADAAEVEKQTGLSVSL
jgi:hypothetical protein